MSDIISTHCSKWEERSVLSAPCRFLFSVRRPLRGTARRWCIMQFGWLKENIKALPYWIWRHVQNRIFAGHSLLLAGIKGITSSSSSPTHTQISSLRQTIAKRTSVRTEICLARPSTAQPFCRKLNFCKPWAKRRRQKNPLVRQMRESFNLSLNKAGDLQPPYSLLSHLSDSFIVLRESGTSGTMKQRWAKHQTPVTSVHSAQSTHSPSSICLIYHPYCLESNHHQTLSKLCVSDGTLMGVMRHIRPAVLTNNNWDLVGICIKRRLSIKNRLLFFQLSSGRHRHMNSIPNVIFQQYHRDNFPC